MPSTNDKILDNVYLRAVDLSRFEEKEKQAILGMLTDIQSNVRKDLVDIKLDPTIPKTLRGKQNRLIALQKQINQTINTGTAKIKRKSQAALLEVARNEAAFSENLLISSVPAEIATSINTVAISPTLLKTIAADTLVDGFTMNEWWSSLGNDIKGKFKRSVREGIVRGEGIGAIVKRVGDVFDKTEHDVRTLVRTSVSTVSNRSREEVWSANEDIISSLKWVSTIDLRTSDLCLVRDNKLYTVDTHKPIGHSYPWESGPGSIHFNCRSTSVSILKSADELGIDASEATRKTMDGKVPQDTNALTWLKGQSAKRQDIVLGKTKGKLYRNGQVKDIRNLFDQTGRAKPLSELPKLKEK